MLYAVKIWISGRLIRIVVDAPGPTDAVRAVWQRMGAGALVVSVEPAETTGLFASLRRGRVSLRDLELFCIRFEVLLRAGITAQEALDQLASQTERRALASALRMASESVKAGFALSASLRAHPHVFPVAFCQTVAAAEEAGALSEALARLAEHYGREAVFREKVRQALMYPVVVFSLALAVTGGMFGFVVPRFAAVLSGAGVPLPWITRVVLAASSKFDQGAALFLIIGGFVAVAWRSARRGKLRGLWERTLLSVPVVGRIVSRSAAARVCRSLALLLETGIPALHALDLAARTAGFSLLEAELAAARDALQGGGSLGKALETSRFFLGASRKMVEVGETSGQLPGMLSQAARLFELEVDALMQRLPPVLETVMLLFVGTSVGFVMLSLFLPIVTMYEAVQK